MARKKYWIGSTGPFLYDDTSLYPDTVNHKGFRTEGTIRAEATPTDPNDVVRLFDITSGGSGAAPKTAEYIVISLDSILTNERNLAITGGLTLTDGGANAAVTLGLPSPFTSGNVLSANGSAFVSLTPNAAGLVDKSSTQTGIAGNKTWTGNHIFQTSVDSTGGFKIMDADGGTAVVNVDTLNERFGIGTDAPLDVLHVQSAGPTISRWTITNSAQYIGLGFYENSTFEGFYQCVGSTFVTVDRRRNLEFFSRLADITFWPANTRFATFKAGGKMGLNTHTPSTVLHSIISDSGTNAVVINVTLGHNSSSTAAAGFGTGIEFQLQDSTTTNVSAGKITYEWVVATHASRTARSKWSVYDTAEREAIRIEASGSAPMIGVYGVAAVARPSAYTQTYSTADKTHAGRTASTLTDNSAGTANTTVEALPDPADTPASADALRDDIVANLLPALRNNFADLAAQINALKADSDDTAQVVNSILDDLQLEGWLQ